ncbi:MAG: hypothetical protein Kow00123_07720 [Anaerolineales bacterium]
MFESLPNLVDGAPPALGFAAEHTQGFYPFGLSSVPLRQTPKQNESAARKGAADIRTVLRFSFPSTGGAGVSTRTVGPGTCPRALRLRAIGRCP